MHTSTLHRTARSLGLMSVGVLSTLGALSLAHVGPASAQSPGVNLAALVARLSADEAAIAALKAQIAAIPAGPKGDPGPQGPAGTAGTNGKNGAPGAKGDPGTPGTNGTNGTNGKDGVNGTNGKDGAQGPAGAGFTPDKIAILNAFTLTNGIGTAPELNVTGVNLHLVNGLGSTATTNGLGNLVVGYNEKDPNFTQTRAGSHNFVVGTGHNYLSYGGIVAGEDNLINAPFASVTGGYLNVARSGHASVTGGSGNVASGGNSLTEGSTLGWKAGSESGISFTTKGNFASD